MENRKQIPGGRKEGEQPLGGIEQQGLLIVMYCVGRGVLGGGGGWRGAGTYIGYNVNCFLESWSSTGPAR